MMQNVFLDTSAKPTAASFAKALKGSSLSEELIRRLVTARKYVEGRGIRVEVKSRRALEQAKILLVIKMAG